MIIWILKTRRTKQREANKRVVVLGLDVKRVGERKEWRVGEGECMNWRDGLCKLIIRGGRGTWYME